MLNFYSDIVHKVSKKKSENNIERMSFSEMLLDLYHHLDCFYYNILDIVTMGLPEGVYI